MVITSISIDYGLVQDCNISIANTLEILQSCTEPFIYYVVIDLDTCISRFHCVPDPVYGLVQAGTTESAATVMKTLYEAINFLHIHIKLFNPWMKWKSEKIFNVFFNMFFPVENILFRIPVTVNFFKRIWERDNTDSGNCLVPNPSRCHYLKPWRWWSSIMPYSMTRGQWGHSL